MNSLTPSSIAPDVVHATIRLLPLLNKKLVYPYKAIYPPDITPSQLQALFKIADAGEIRLAELADYCGMKKQQLTPIINALEHAGYMVRTIDPGNRRIVRASLTERGKELLREVDANIVAALEPCFAVFSEQETQEMYCCVKDLASFLERMP